MYKKYIPTFTYDNIFDIDYQTLKNGGITTLFFDLDNTIIDYHTNYLSTEIKDFLNNLSNDFKIVIVSNSPKKRVRRASESFNYVYSAMKPLKAGYKKALKIVDSFVSEVACIGDQMMTDIYGANLIGAGCSILVKPINRKSDKFYTKFNRFFQRRILRKIQKKEPLIYESLKDYV